MKKTIHTVITRARLALPSTPDRSIVRAAVALGALVTLTACGGTGTVYRVTVRDQIPDPVVDPLPLTVVIHYTPEFSNYTSEQESLAGDTWQVEFGNLHQNYMHSMLTEAFDIVLLAPTDKPPANLDYDLFLVPQVENFSFLTPAESGTKFFAASMRHFVHFFGPDGTDFGSWEINSYGRSRSTFARPVYELAEEAVLDAMRDFAVSIVVGLPEEVMNRNIVGTDTGGAR